MHIAPPDQARGLQPPFRIAGMGQQTTKLRLGATGISSSMESVWHFQIASAIVQTGY